MKKFFKRNLPKLKIVINSYNSLRKIAVTTILKVHVILIASTYSYSYK